MNIQSVSRETMQGRLIRYNELIPCKSAFIDAHTPNSDKKDNFCIIGPGVAENPNQHVHLRLPHGYNIGAAGQPPHITNSLHSHFSAEVFMVFSGTWRIFWGAQGQHEAVVKPGEVVNVPTNMFRGFQNIGDDYGMMFTVLGGDDCGGGVVWAPQVLEAAQDHGLVLLEDGTLIDTKAGETIPAGHQPVQPMSAQEVARFDEYSVAEMLARFVCTTEQLRPELGTRLGNAGLGTEYVRHHIIGPTGQSGTPVILQDDQAGFNLYGIAAVPGQGTSVTVRGEQEVWHVSRGQWRLSWGQQGEQGSLEMGAGDVISIPAGVPKRLENIGPEDGFCFNVVNGVQADEAQIL
ncbi:cupin domain-containing protein [Zobellella maritima]|uniref:cupin n=1 Tax=Zobellella maritima TaxID=2059725 RepID=UPI000E30AF54|nr:cupin [Zobellella maritima]